MAWPLAMSPARDLCQGRHLSPSGFLSLLFPFPLRAQGGAAWLPLAWGHTHPAWGVARRGTGRDPAVTPAAPFTSWFPKSGLRTRSSNSIIRELVRNAPQVECHRAAGAGHQGILMPSRLRTTTAVASRHTLGWGFTLQFLSRALYCPPNAQ